MSVRACNVFGRNILMGNPSVDVSAAIDKCCAVRKTFSPNHPNEMATQMVIYWSGQFLHKYLFSNVVIHVVVQHGSQFLFFLFQKLAKSLGKNWNLIRTDGGEGLCWQANFVACEMWMFLYVESKIRRQTNNRCSFFFVSFFLYWQRFNFFPEFQNTKCMGHNVLVRFTTIRLVSVHVHVHSSNTKETGRIFFQPNCICLFRIGGRMN